MSSNLLIKIKKTFFLNKEEKFFFKNIKNNESSKKNENILYNATEDYKSLCFRYSLTKDNLFRNYKFIFYLPLLSWHRANLSTNLIVFFVKFIFNNLILIFRNKKWILLYGSKNYNFITLNNFNFFKEIKYLKEAKKILLTIDSKKKLQKLKINNLLVGDLIYDTYLRFNNKVTVEFNDSFLVEVVAKTLSSIEKLKIIKKNYEFKFFFTNQLAYIYHGLPTRFLKHDTKVKNFMWTSGSFYSTVSKYFYSYNFLKYNKIFKKCVDNKKKAYKDSLQLLKSKFSGKILDQENFMPISVYNNSRLKLKKKIIGVVFLHCFVDSPTSRGKCIFDDFHDWTLNTLNFFNSNSLDKYIAIKPHPDGKPPSFDFIEKLKKKYPNFIWLNPKTSNKLIFKKKPLFGISVMGTVLHELAFHKILPISAGEHAAIAYNFVKTAKSKKNYFQILKLALKNKFLYKPSKKEILEWVYMTYLYDNSPAEHFGKKIGLKNWNLANPKNLLNFTKIYNSIS